MSRTGHLPIVVMLLAACTSTVSPPTPSGSFGQQSTAPSTSEQVFINVGEVRIELCGKCVAAAEVVGVDITALTRQTVARILNRLPAVSTRVLVTVDPGDVIPGIGVGGYADPTSGAINLALDPDAADFATSLRVWLPQALAHELHHTARVQVGPGFGPTLLDRMVTEGLADAFSLQVFPNTPSIPWDHALTDAQERKAWQQARSHLTGEFADQAVWFFGAGQVPFWAGYTIGFGIVSSYLRLHPRATPAGLVRMDARRVLLGSHFHPELESTDKGVGG